MSKQVCVIGLGRFGLELATTLYQSGHEVVAIDRDNRKVQEMLGKVTYAVEADATGETALRDLGVGDMDAAVVALGSQVQSSIIITMLLKSMGLPFVIARAVDERHAEILSRVGADKVIFPEKEAATRAAKLGMEPNFLDFISISESVGVHMIRPPERMRGQSLQDAGLYGGTGTRLVVTALRRGYDCLINPGAGEVIGDGDILIVVGDHREVARAFER